MKRIVLTLLAILLVIAFAAGCGVEDPLNPSTTEPTEAPTVPEKLDVDDMDYDDSIEGIYNYMLALELMSDVQPTAMAAELIGAEKGNKYSYTVNGSQVNVELYSYDTKNLNELAKEIIKSVEETNTFEILNLGEVEAMISDSGKYLLIYSDKSLDSDSPNEDNLAVYNKFVEAFKAFHN